MDGGYYSKGPPLWLSISKFHHKRRQGNSILQGGEELPPFMMEKNMIWHKPEDIKIEPDKEYLLRLPGCYVVGVWSKGSTFDDEAGRFHWRNGRLWYPDALVLAVMEIPDCPFDGKVYGWI